MFSLDRFIKWTIIIGLVLLIAIQVFAANLYSNLPGTADGNWCVTSDYWPAGGFSVPAGTDYQIDSINIALSYAGSTVTAFLFDDAGGIPGNQIRFIGSQVYSGGGGIITISATPPVILSAGTNYWLVFKGDTLCRIGVTGTGFDNGPAPTGVFTVFGTLRQYSVATSMWADHAPDHASIQINGAPYASNTSSCPTFFDGRINNCDEGNWIVIYGHDYESGHGLYIVSDEGLELLQVSPEQITAVSECPDVNTLIASGNGVSVYRLAGSCEYQVNGPAADGKTYVVNFDELYADAGYTSHEE